MIIRNIRLAVRGLLKNRIVTVINIIGLTIGITISMFIFSYANKEIATDSNITNRDNIYALKVDEASNISQKMANLIKDELLEIKHLTYCSNEWASQVFLVDNNNSYKVENLLVTDSAFFRVFQFQALWGDPVIALNSSNKIVLCQSLAEKIFGNINPIGRTLTYNSTYLQGELLTVGAVIKDLPHNSSWSFDAIMSLQTNYKIDWYARNIDMWGNKSFYSYFSLQDNVNLTALKDKFENLRSKGLPEEQKDAVFSFVPFTEVYFNSPEHEELKHGNRFTLTIIQTTGVLILLLACINYINLITAQKEKRSRNISIFRALGSNKRKIIELVLTESGLLLILVLALVILLLGILLNMFNQLTNSQFTLSSFFAGWNMGVFMVIFIMTFGITGVLPGIVFSRQKTNLLLKRSVSGGSSLRNGLLVFQFTISIILLSCIFFIYQQNTFLNNTNPGFQKENIIYMSTNDDIQNSIQAFKNGLEEISGISDLTFSDAPIGNIDQDWGMKFINRGEKGEIHFSKMGVSPNFFSFFGIKLSQGRYFTESSNKNLDVIFNETAIKKYNITNINDARAVLNDDVKNGNIIGVVKDFNFESMHKPLRSAGFICSGEFDEFAYLKINAKNYTGIQQTLKSIEDLWATLSPNFPFEYKFLNDSWNELYKKDKQFQEILSYATITSLFLSCLGLIGLTFFVIESKIKEIGIRKVNGAKTTEIIKMLNKIFLKWLAIAFFVACPVAFYAMSNWLENFAYKTELSWWIFALAGVIAISIALITVSWQSWRAASKNPVEALRYE